MLEMVSGVPVVPAAAWLIWKIWLPTVTVALRAAPELVATANPILALPLLATGPVSTTQLALLAAAHWHPLPVVRLMVPVPPAAGTDCVGGVRV